MLKDHDPPKEPLRVKAGRKWKNNDLRKRLIEERKFLSFVFSVGFHNIVVDHSDVHDELWHGHSSDKEW
jgi:hypothetical protein